MYEQFLQDLLAPLGIYDPAAGLCQRGGGVRPLGGGLDAVWEHLETTERRP